MGKIKNTESLLNHGDRESRKKITELLERMWAHTMSSSFWNKGGRIPSD